jgi:hypothetical protein
VLLRVLFSQAVRVVLLAGFVAVMLADLGGMRTGVLEWATHHLLDGIKDTLLPVPGG